MLCNNTVISFQTQSEQKNFKETEVATYRSFAANRAKLERSTLGDLMRFKRADRKLLQMRICMMYYDRRVQ